MSDSYEMPVGVDEVVEDVEALETQNGRLPPDASVQVEPEVADAAPVKHVEMSAQHLGPTRVNGF